MTMSEEYFEWIIEKLGLKNYSQIPYENYTKLLWHLLYKEFKVVDIFNTNTSHDENRITDAKVFREAGNKEFKVSRVAGNSDDIYPISILEIVATMAIKIEQNELFDFEAGDQTPQWFWMMLRNLCLLEFNNSRYDSEVVNKRLDDFINRKYYRNGAGGLFVTKNESKDMRLLDIWSQMNVFVSEYVN